ncbi:MAG TPA: hypothetical protein VN737_07475 [Bryobacteraceae bacterium]|nr:hypothetical protein [Bryobacteraceae bacterium]
MNRLIYVASILFVWHSVFAQDLNVTTLGPNFSGADIQAAVSNLQKSEANLKGEFETTTQYQARINAAKTNGRRTYVFVLGQPDTPFGDTFLYGPSFNYDADNGVMDARIYARTIIFHLEPGNPNYPVMGLRRVKLSHEEYVASNAFGAKTVVSKSVEDVFGIALTSGNGLFQPSADKSRGTFEAVITFRVPIPIAKDLKPNLRIGLVCVLEQPTILEGVSFHEPTIDSPYDLFAEHKYLSVLPVQILVFDARGGAILARSGSEQTVGDSQRTLGGYSQ